MVTQRQLGKVRLFLAGNPVLNVLPLGDCYQPLLKVSKLLGAYEGAKVAGACSVYYGFSKPSVVLSLASTETKKALLGAAMEMVTGEFTTLCSRDELELFKEHAAVLNAEVEYQMIANPPKNSSPNRIKARRVRKKELNVLDTFYCEHRSEAWTPLQFKVGPFYCVKMNGRIVSAAGTHVASPQIAHMGSVVTDEAFRRRGFAMACTSRVAEHLSLKGRRMVSLFVRTENGNAISMYERLGFKITREITLAACKKLV
jgi:GNAT superfamily N-acetyltransferase